MDNTPAAVFSKFPTPSDISMTPKKLIPDPSHFAAPNRSAKNSLANNAEKIGVVVT